MKYKSTRNSNIRYSSAHTIAQGISEEGGLFVPEVFPNIFEKLEAISKMNYFDRSKEILKCYLSDFTDAEIEICVKNAYGNSKFENDTPAKLVSLKNGLNILELWHGPTCAFKDMALQLLPHLLTKSLEKCGDGKTAIILVATSGDTGKAALEGFKNIKDTQIIVFYPENGVSAMQLKQMNTQDGENVSVCAVEGNFDDCQTQVKQIFTNDSVKEILDKNNMVFSSANSINWGRLLPQIIYYFSSYCDLVNNGKIKLNDKINVVVPTGNFGNILAAYYAMKMGLPINKFICASNSNNVLTDFIKTGTYSTKRSFYTTVSPSMDILVSSNLERLLYNLCDDNSGKISNWMFELSKNGSYTVDKNTKKIVNTLFFGGSSSDDETIRTINLLFKSANYLCDTHTAVAIKVYNDYVNLTGDITPSIIVSTASPYKFASDVLSAISNSSESDEFLIAEQLSKISDTKIPLPLLSLKNKKKRFTNHTEKATIADFVLKTIGVE